MGTSAYIARKTEQGNYVAAYVHYDGYLDGVGATLLENYNNDDTVKALLEYSYLSTLRNTLDELGTGKYDHVTKEHSDKTAYSSTDELLEAIVENCINYLYVWENGGWQYAKIDLGNEQNDYKITASPLFELVVE